jgi:hypothetical protein
VNSGSNFLKKQNADYWEGVQEGDFVIKEKKLCLGSSLRVTVLAVLKLYAEMEPKDPKDPRKMRAQRNRVHPDLAAQFPVGESNFTRDLPNGNTLEPMHYVYLLLNDHPDVGVVILATQSTANKAITPLMRQLKSESLLSAELQFYLTSVPNDDWLIPDFQMASLRNFAVKDAALQQVNGGFDTDTILQVLKKAKEIHKQFADGEIAIKEARKLLGVTTTPTAVTVAAATEETPAPAPARARVRF